MKYPTQEELDQFGAYVDVMGDLILLTNTDLRLAHYVWCPLELQTRPSESSFRRAGVWGADVHGCAQPNELVPFTDPVAAMAYVRIQEQQA